jgi:hypothetical protein
MQDGRCPILYPTGLSSTRSIYQRAARRKEASRAVAQGRKKQKSRQKEEGRKRQQKAEAEPENDCRCINEYVMKEET